MSWLDKVSTWFRNLPISDSAFPVVLRWFIAAGIGLRPVALPSEYTPARLATWYALLLIFLGYSLIVTLASRYERLERVREWHVVQAVIDVIFISLFYGLSGIPSSDLFLFYALPLLIAGERLRARHVSLFFCLISIAFMITLVYLVSHRFPNLSIIQSFMTFGRYFLPRWTFFLFLLSLVFVRGTIYKRQAEELEAVRTTAISIAKGEALQPRLTAIIDAAIDILRAKGCAIYLKVANRNAAKVVALKGVESDIFKVGYELTFKQGLLGLVFKSKEPIIENDYPRSVYRVVELAGLFHAIIEYPLIFGGEVMGVIALYHHAGHEFSEADYLPLERLAQHATVAIRDIQLLEEKKEQAAILEILNDAGREMTASLNLRETSNAIATNVAKLAESFNNVAPLYTSVALLTEDSRYLECVACFPEEAYPELKERMQRIDLSLDRSGVVGRAIKTNSSQLVANVKKDPDYLEVFESANTELAVPIRGRDKVIGVINIEHGAPDAYPDKLIPYIEGLSGQAGVALANDSLFQENTDARRTEEELRHAEESLREASFAISSVYGVKNVARAILDNLKRLVPCKHSALELVREGSTEVLAKYNLDDKQASSFIREAESMDLQAKPGIAVIPLKQADTVIARITVDSSEPQSHNNLVRLYSNYAASALQNALLLEQNENQIRELRETQEKLELVLEHLEAHHNLAMIGLVFGESIHFAGNELGMAKANARNIIQHFYASDDELHTISETIIRYIDDYLKVLREIQDEVMAPMATRLNVHLALDNTLESKRISSNIRVVKNYRIRDPGIWAPVRQLRQVFLVILQNAITAMNGEGTLTLATKDQVSNGDRLIEVSIADTGSGIPKRVQEDLFKIKPIRLGKRGMQLGLPWAHSFLRTYGGALDFETSESGTLFRITIPVDWRKARRI